MGIHFLDQEGNFHIRPFIFGWKSKRDPVTLRKISTVDRSKRYPIELFVNDEPYKLLWLIESDIHLFGVQGSKIHLFGHSQGGLTSRYIVANMGMSGKVRTLTTIDSVHRGTPFADIGLAVIPTWLEPFVAVVLNTIGGLVSGGGRQGGIDGGGRDSGHRHVLRFQGIGATDGWPGC